MVLSPDSVMVATDTGRRATQGGRGFTARRNRPSALQWGGGVFTYLSVGAAAAAGRGETLCLGVLSLPASDDPRSSPGESLFSHRNTLDCHEDFRSRSIP